MINTPLVVWRVSLADPIPFDEQNRHIIRLFPHGGAIFLTEDLMLHDPHRALKIVEWFPKFYDTRLPGSWKLVLRPTVKEWLLETAEATRDGR